MRLRDQAQWANMHLLRLPWGRRTHKGPSPQISLNMHLHHLWVLKGGRMIVPILPEMTAPIESCMESMAQTIPYIPGKLLVGVLMHKWQQGRDNHKCRPSDELGSWCVCLIPLQPMQVL